MSLILNDAYINTNFLFLIEGYNIDNIITQRSATSLEIKLSGKGALAQVLFANNV